MNLYQPTITGSLSVSGSVNISGSITIAGGGTISGTASIATTALTASSADNFLTRGTLTAQTLVVQTITSSVDFVTGSTRFGSISANTHVFTGSMAVSGGLVVSSTTPELTVGATGVTLGNVITDTHTITGSIGISGSATFASSVTANSTINGYFGGITTGQLPATSGTTPNNPMLNLTNNRGVGLYVGGQHASPFGIWMQVADTTNLGVYYPLLLQPNGSNVGIGTSNPNRKLVVVGGNGNQLELDNTGQTYTQQFWKINGNEVGTIWASTSEFHMYTYGSQPILFSTNNAERMRITNGSEIVRGPIREFAQALSPPDPYTGDARLNITHNPWGGNNDSGTVYVEFQARAYGNNQTTTAFGIITYRLGDNGINVTNVSTAGVTTSNVTITTDVSSNYILRIRFGVTQNTDRISVFARTTNGVVSLISADIV